MCGLYSLAKSADEVASLFRLGSTPMLAPRQHVTPGGPIAILRPENGALALVHVRWGLIPSWVKQVQPGKPLTNARAETVLEKASFKHAMKRRRCLIPADGFYEWQGETGRKQPWLFRRPDFSCFAFAGLWESWMGADGSEMESAAIITIEANRMVGEIHNRMPVVILPEDYARWLDCTNVPDVEAHAMLKTGAEDFFIREKVTIPKPARPEPKPSPQPSLF
jgi:putative SOS response-associated peptidase YedK